jgi:hypothetical protein
MIQYVNQGDEGETVKPTAERNKAVTFYSAQSGSRVL